MNNEKPLHVMRYMFVGKDQNKITMQSGMAGREQKYTFESDQAALVRT